MKYYIIAGESSGDIHGAKLMAGIKKRDNDAQFRCWGGENMEKEGGVIVKHYKDLAFMGFAEVVMHLKTIVKNLKFCKEDILQWQPDAVILVDYPGFNMRIAEFAKQQNFKVYYYISPQVWAWKKKRIHKIHRSTDIAFVILPFEKEFHAQKGYHVEYTGHPMPDSMDLEKPFDIDAFRKFNGLSEKPIIALLPGSRKHELKRMLPVMADIQSKMPAYQLVVAGVHSLGKDFYTKFIKTPHIPVIFGQTHDILRASRAAAVTSGTATLETGMLQTPQVVCYKMNWITAIIALVLVKVKFISLVNLILDRKAVEELIQHKCTSENIVKYLKPLAEDTPERHKMLEDYKELLEKVGKPGASDRAAEIMVNHLKANTI